MGKRFDRGWVVLDFFLFERLHHIHDEVNETEPFDNRRWTFDTIVLSFRFSSSCCLLL